MKVPQRADFQSRRVRVMVLAGLLVWCALPSAASAQQQMIELPRFDPTAMLAMGDEVLLRAPDPAIDRLFRAVRASSRSDIESAALCELFEPEAARDLPALQRVVARLGDASRERFMLAFADVALAGLQGQPQPWDPVHAQQVLKQAAVSAAFLHDGFSAGLASEGRDEASRRARCRSFRWLVGVLDGLPVADRAAATRWLLREGLAVTASSVR